MHCQPSDKSSMVWGLVLTVINMYIPQHENQYFMSED